MTTLYLRRPFAVSSAVTPRLVGASLSVLLAGSVLACRSEGSESVRAEDSSLAHAAAGLGAQKAALGDPEWTRGAAGEAAEFSVFLLPMAWGPNFCKRHPRRDQCSTIEESFAGHHLTLHGLWPNYDDREAAAARSLFPEYCGAYAACRRGGGADCHPTEGAIPTEFAEVAPGYFAEYRPLGDHEWPKHGSCTGLSDADYFEAALDTMMSVGDRGTPAAIAENVGELVPLVDLQAAYAPEGSAVFGCDGACNLSEVTTCWDKDAAGLPGDLVVCPLTVSLNRYNNSCALIGCVDVRIEQPKPPKAPKTRGAKRKARKARKAAMALTGNAQCDKNGKGPSCSSDDDCLEAGWLRCADRSQCCANRAKSSRR